MKQQTIRPGVYTSYSFSPSWTQTKGKSIGIVAQNSTVVSEVQTVRRFSDANVLFGEQTEKSSMLQLLQVVYQNASPIVYAVCPENTSEEAYQIALEKLFAIPDCYLIITDYQTNGLDRFLSKRIEECAANGHEMLAILSSGERVDIIADALACNSMRVCMTAPKITTNDSVIDVSHAVLSSMISRCETPSNSLNGETAGGVYQVSKAYEENELTELVKSGVCVLESVANSLELVRGVTTKTMDEAGKPDATYRNLNVVLVADIVIPQIRSTLVNRLKKSANSTMSLDAMRSLVVCQLEDFVESEYLSSYEMPLVYLSAEDDTVCMVEVQFTITQGLSQIYLHAQIVV